MSRIRVVVVGALPMLRDGIVQALAQAEDIKVVGQVGSAPESFTMITSLAPDVVVTDTGLRRFLDPIAVQRIKKARPKCSIVALVADEDGADLSCLIEGGVEGVLLTTANGSELVQTIRAVHNGQLVLESAIGHRMLKMRHERSFPKRNARFVLTDRELETLKMVAKAKTSVEIAIALGINQRTVKGHLSNAFGKLGARSRTQAVLIGLKLGLLSFGDVWAENEVSLVPGEKVPNDAPSSFGFGELDFQSEAGRRSFSGRTSLGLDQSQPYSSASQDYTLAGMNDALSRALIEETQEGYFLIQDQKYVFVNRRMAEMLGYSQSELIGKPFVQVMPLDLQQQTLRVYWARILGDRVPERFGLTLLGKDGLKVPVTFSVKVITYKGRPAIVGVISSAGTKSISEAEFRLWVRTKFSSSKT